MSSDCWDDSSVYIWNVLGSSHPGFLATAEPFNEYAVRPVISLKSCITFESGDGTSLNPYIVSISDACAILEN